MLILYIFGKQFKGTGAKEQDHDTGEFSVNWISMNMILHNRNSLKSIDYEKSFFCIYCGFSVYFLL
jgi:hypothetical protein